MKTAPTIRTLQSPQGIFTSSNLDKDAKQNTIRKPQVITLAVNLLWALWVIGLLILFVDFPHVIAETNKATRQAGWPPMVGYIVAIFVRGISDGLFVFFNLKLSAGRNWARIVMLVLFVVGIPFGIPKLSAEFNRSPFLGVFALAQIGVCGYAMLLLFTEPGSRWFCRLR